VIIATNEYGSSSEFGSIVLITYQTAKKDEDDHDNISSSMGGVFETLENKKSLCIMRLGLAASLH
jgi:hypothetical protein